MVDHTFNMRLFRHLSQLFSKNRATPSILRGSHHEVYTFAKSLLEDYDSSSSHQTGISAAAAVAVLDNDLMILNTTLMLGDHIAGFRKVAPSAGMTNPFEQPAVEPVPPFMSIDSPPIAKDA